MTNITVSLEKAKMLKSIGWDKATFFKENIYWEPDIWEWNREMLRPVIWRIYKPTAQELLDVLPYRTELRKIYNKYWVRYKPNKNSVEWCYMEKADTAADALADLVKRCVDNWYLSFDESDEL